MSNRHLSPANGRPGPPASCVRASLIILNYDGRDVLDACIESLAGTASDADEIIVVDNASSDDSGEKVAARSDVRLVALEQNTYIFGLNEGLARARGEFVAFLNNDIVVEPDFVARCIERFSDGHDVFAVCPRILDRHARDQGSRTRGEWHRGLLLFQPLAHTPEATDCFFAVGGQSFFRRAMLEEIGSIDPLLWPMYHEDIELAYRAWKRGWRIRYAPDAVVHHVGGHSSSRVFTPAQLRSFVRQNEYLTVWKNVTDWNLMAQHIALIPLRLAAAAVRGDWPSLRGFASAVRRLPRVSAARRGARRHIRLTDREVLRKISSIA
jgi:GT2 family glycosyltransferase